MWFCPKFSRSGLGKVLVLASLFGQVVCLPNDLAAQSESPPSDPRVEKLYGEAKAAQAAGDREIAAAKYESILKIAPHLGAAYNNLGLLYFQQRQFEKATAILEKGLKVDPKMPSAQALLGLSLYEMGKYADARLHLEAALHANPKDNNAELILAKDLSNLKEFEAAAAHLRELARREPNDQEVWYLLGKAYMSLSEQALTKMNAIDPNSVLVHEMSGQIMENMKNYDGALVEYKKAVEMAPQQAGTHYMLGNVYFLLADWDRAMEQFQAELANDPSNCRAQALIGNVLLEQRREPEQALSRLDKALATCPNLSEARADRGRALIRLNRNEEAVKELQIAERASPDNAVIHFHLAQAYKALGRTQEAKAEMQLFAQLEDASHAATAKRAQELIKTKDETH